MTKKREKKKKDVVLVFGITKDYAFALANTLIGLKKHNKRFWDDIIVYHDGLIEHEKKCINEVLPVNFVDLSESEHFKRINEVNLDSFNKYSVAAFYRYECFRLLENYHKVIWNDVDILIQDDISGLLKYGNESGMAFSLALPHFVMGSSLKKLIVKYDNFAPLWNDGIMVLTDKLQNHHRIYDWCVEATKKYKDVLLWPDLAVLNMALQEFKITPENIDREKYVCLPMSENTEKAVILHAYGDKKFWNNLNYMNKYSEWIENAAEWSRLSYAKQDYSCPLVSCVMSCYERYDYLYESINSLLAQSYSNIEIIVVLEKSDKQTEIAEYLEDIDDKRIRIIKNKTKLGFAASLNVGIDVARGKYVARMDDDDIAMVRRLEMQVKYMENHPKVGIVGGNMRVFGNYTGCFSAFSEDKFIKATALFCTPFMHPTVMMRKSMMDKYKLRYNPDYFTEDYELWSRAVYCFECANLPEVLTFYRSHNSQATWNNDLKIHASHKKVMREQLKKYLKLSLSENELELLQMRKDCIGKVADIDGAFALRKVAMDKIMEANRKYGIYDERALWYIINLGKPSLRDGGVESEIPMENDHVTRSRLKRIIKPIINPIYSRLIGKMETMMMNHDEELRVSLQKQIDEINEKSGNIH